MTKSTIFKSITQTQGGQDCNFGDIMDGIKNGDWRAKVQYYRDLPENTEDQIKIKKEAKKNIPYFTGSGTFEKRSDAGLTEHNGRIILDLDGIDNIDDALALVCGDSFTEYAFRSVGGYGLAVVIKIDPEKHLESWKGLTNYFKEKYNLIVDKATKDLSRARFVSYDPELYYNPNAKTFLLDRHDETAKERAKNIIDSAVKGEVHNALIRASRLLGGYIAGGMLDEHEAEEFLVGVMSQKPGVVSIDIERKKIKDGINNGKLDPITPEKITQEKKQTERDAGAWREVYSFANEINRAGRPFTHEDLKNVCEIHLLPLNKVRAAFEKIFNENKDEYGINDKPEIAKVEVFLRKNWEFAENEITQVAEFRKKGEPKFKVLNTDTIYRKMQHVGFKYPLDKLKSLLRSDFMYRYNPFKDYFNSLPEWDGQTDYINELANYVQVEDQEFFKTQFKKCLVRCIGCSVYGVENRIVFVLVGEKQSTGKSTFLRFLNPFGQKYYTEAAIHNNKDSSFALAENFIYNLEELASLSNIDVNRLKSVISTSTIKERKPYAASFTDQPRRANFFGSTNKTEFLTDTENTRWLCFNLVSINWNYKKNINIHDVWAQAFALYKDPEFNDNLTAEEAEYRDSKNKSYEINDYEKELIKRHFQVCKKSEGVFYSNADVLDALQDDAPGKKLDPRFISKNMIQLGFERGLKRLNGHPTRGYYVKKIIGDYKEDQPEQPKFF